MIAYLKIAVDLLQYARLLYGQEPLADFDSPKAS